MASTSHRVRVAETLEAAMNTYRLLRTEHSNLAIRINVRVGLGFSVGDGAGGRHGRQQLSMIERHAPTVHYRVARHS